MSNRSGMVALTDNVLQLYEVKVATTKLQYLQDTHSHFYFV
jgi:hypothetical protein